MLTHLDQRRSSNLFGYILVTVFVALVLSLFPLSNKVTHALLDGLIALVILSYIAVFSLGVLIFILWDKEGRSDYNVTFYFRLGIETAVLGLLLVVSSIVYDVILINEDVTTIYISAITLFLLMWFVLDNFVFVLGIIAELRDNMKIERLD